MLNIETEMPNEVEKRFEDQFFSLYLDPKKRKNALKALNKNFPGFREKIRKTMKPYKESPKAMKRQGHIDFLDVYHRVLVAPTVDMGGQSHDACDRYEEVRCAIEYAPPKGLTFEFDKEGASFSVSLGWTETRDVRIGVIDLRTGRFHSSSDLPHYLKTNIMSRSFENIPGRKETRADTKIADRLSALIGKELSGKQVFTPKINAKEAIKLTYEAPEHYIKLFTKLGIDIGELVSMKPEQEKKISREVKPQKKRIQKQQYREIAGQFSLSRSEARKKYENLSPETRDLLNLWINDRFWNPELYGLSTFQKPPEKILYKKLDPENPEHRPWINDWLNHRDLATSLIDSVSIDGVPFQGERPSIDYVTTAIEAEQMKILVKEWEAQNPGKDLMSNQYTATRNELFALSDVLLQAGCFESDRQQLKALGYETSDITKFIERNMAKGFNEEQIGSALFAQMELMDYLTNDMLNGSIPKAREALGRAKFNPTRAIADEKFKQLSEKWEKDNPNRMQKTTETLDLYAKALDFASELHKKYLERAMGKDVDTRGLVELYSEKPRDQKKPESPEQDLRRRTIQEVDRSKHERDTQQLVRERRAHQQ